MVKVSELLHPTNMQVLDIPDTVEMMDLLDRNNIQENEKQLVQDYMDKLIKVCRQLQTENRQLRMTHPSKDDAELANVELGKTDEEPVQLNMRTPVGVEVNPQVQASNQRGKEKVVATTYPLGAVARAGKSRTVEASQKPKASSTQCSDVVSFVGNAIPVPFHNMEFRWNQEFYAVLKSTGSVKLRLKSGMENADKRLVGLMHL